MSVLLSVSGLTCRFGTLAAVDGVDLELSPGQRRAVIGPNGAGKTTLLNAIAGNIRPTGGRIRFAGRDITTAGPARRARWGIARTFQTPALCPSLTALENVTLGLRPGWWHRRHRGDALLRALHQLDALGLGNLAGTPVGQLAHGQRRLLEIGVALVQRPRLLLLDEPAAGLTTADRPRLLHCLRQLPGEVSVLLVEHHMDVVAALADTVTVLHQGRVIAHGPPAAINDHPAVHKVYLGDEQQAVT